MFQEFRSSSGAEPLRDQDIFDAERDTGKRRESVAASCHFVDLGSFAKSALFREGQEGTNLGIVCSDFGVMRFRQAGGGGYAIPNRLPGTLDIESGEIHFLSFNDFGNFKKRAIRGRTVFHSNLVRQGFAKALADIVPHGPGGTVVY